MVPAPGSALQAPSARPVVEAISAGRVRLLGQLSGAYLGSLRAQGAACGGTVPGAAGERKQPLLPLSNPPWASPTPGWHWERGEEMQVYQVPPVPRGGCSREPTRGSGCCLH